MRYNPLDRIRSTPFRLADQFIAVGWNFRRRRPEGDGTIAGQVVMRPLNAQLIDLCGIQRMMELVYPELLRDLIKNENIRVERLDLFKQHSLRQKRIDSEIPALLL